MEVEKVNEADARLSELTADTSHADPSQKNIYSSAPNRSKPLSFFKKFYSKIGWKKSILAAFLLLLFGSGLLISQHFQQVKPLPLTKITVRLQWLHGAEFAGMYVAREKNYYKDAGLEVDLKEEEDGLDINKEVFNGVVDYGVSTPLEVILSRNKGHLVKSIAAIYQTSPYVIAATKSSNINNLADFKGKILGALGGNNEANVTYKALLIAGGLTQSDAVIKNVDFDAVKVLKDHDADTADIYRTDQTFLLDQAKVEYTLVYPERYGLNTYGDMLVASDKKISENPEQTQAFVTATLKGWQYAIDHQDETLSILTKYENEAYKIAGYEKYVLTATAPLIRPTGNRVLGSMDFSVWNRILLSTDTAGLLKTSIEVQDLYTSQFLR